MEFHVVILCGRGKGLSPFSQVRSTGTPKALLPVANRPMIEYVLEWCEKAFFPKVTIVADSDSSEDIQNALDGYKLRKAKSETSKEEHEVSLAEDVSHYSTSIDLLTLDTENSGEVLYHMYSKSILKPYRHFVILPCDFITNLPPQVLIEAYRNKADSDVGMLVHHRNKLDIEDKKSKIFPKNYTFYSELSDGQTELLDIYTKEDIDFHKSLQIRTQMCWRYPNATISTKLLNSSIFFGSDKIFEIFEENQDKFTEAYFGSRSITKVVRDLARRSWKHSKNKETIGFLVLPHQATFFRCNNTPVLMEANRYFMKLQAISKSQQQSSQPKDKTAANIGIDSLIGTGTELGEKTNVKRTMVGSNCSIGRRVKLTGCLLLDNVMIEDDVQLENCIIGHDVLIHSKSRLTSCSVESTFEVAKGTHSKGDTLLCFSLEGLVDGDGSAIKDSEDESESDDETASDSVDDAYDDEYVDNDDGLFSY